MSWCCPNRGFRHEIYMVTRSCRRVSPCSWSPGGGAVHASRGPSAPLGGSMAGLDDPDAVSRQSVCGAGSVQRCVGISCLVRVPVVGAARRMYWATWPTKLSFPASGRSSSTHVLGMLGAGPRPALSAAASRVPAAPVGNSLHPRGAPPVLVGGPKNGTGIRDHFSLRKTRRRTVRDVFFEAESGSGMRSLFWDRICDPFFRFCQCRALLFRFSGCCRGTHGVVCISPVLCWPAWCFNCLSAPTVYASADHLELRARCPDGAGCASESSRVQPANPRTS
jgi:hypothetical protein